jgi:hypothetical protein
MKFFTLPSPFQGRFSGVNYTVEIISAVTMTPLKSFQRRQ